MTWKTRAEWLALTKKPKLAVFYYKELEKGRMTLESFVSTRSHFGQREWTHYYEVPEMERSK